MGRMNKLYIFATIVELFGISMTSAGLAYEVAVGADLGYVVMSIGSVFIATGSLLFAKVAPWMRQRGVESVGKT